MALHAAIEQNDTTALAKLLDKSASSDGGVDQQDRNGWTPLLAACGHGHLWLRDRCSRSRLSPIVHNFAGVAWRLVGPEWDYKGIQCHRQEP